MGPIRNPNWSTSGMRVTLSYLLLLRQIYRQYCRVYSSKRVRLMVFYATFNNISVVVAVSFIGGGNMSIRKKPPTCRKLIVDCTKFHFLNELYTDIERLTSSMYFALHLKR